MDLGTAVEFMVNGKWRQGVVVELGEPKEIDGEMYPQVRVAWKNMVGTNYKSLFPVYPAIMRLK